MGVSLIKARQLDSLRSLRQWRRVFVYGHVENERSRAMAAISNAGPLSRDDGEDDIGIHPGGEEQASSSQIGASTRTREQHDAALQETLSILRSWRSEVHEEDISTLTMTTETRWRQSLDSGGWPMSTDDGEPEYAERVLPPEEPEAASFAWLECGLPPMPKRYPNAPRFEWVPGGFDCRARTPQALIDMFRKVTASLTLTHTHARATHTLASVT